MAKKQPTTEVESIDTAATEYTVLARRYRPQQFADLIGQEPVAQSLINAIQSGRVAHAYLFTGARGVGKTSAARILAKALNCAKGPTATPCDVCEQCLAIASGEDTDVLEIDGASNRGIDEIREIRANVQYRPSRGRYKIYIIDEVHMLTSAAFNALLKTLEEPPAHVKFIFATTESNKIPITILSRCQRFDFSGIGTAQIVARLRQVVEGEHMQADDEALQIVARRGAGSMRDAQSLLDQLLSFAQDRLTVDEVHRLLGTANDERIAQLAGAVLSLDSSKAIDLLGDALDTGLQLGELFDQLIDYWRDLMIVSCGGAERETVSVTGALRQTLIKQAQQISLDTILAGLDVLVSAKNRLKWTNNGRVVVEIALVRLSRLDNLVAISELTQLLSGDIKAQVVPRTTTSVAAPQLEKKKPAPTPEIAAIAVPKSITPESLPHFWQQVVSQSGFAISVAVRSVVDVAISGPKSLVIRFPASYNQQDAPVDAGQLAAIEGLVSKNAGEPWKVRAETIAPDANSAKAPPKPPTRRARNDVSGIPLIDKAREVLGAQVVQTDEEFGAVPDVLPVAGENDSTDEE